MYIVANLSLYSKWESGGDIFLTSVRGIIVFPALSCIPSVGWDPVKQIPYNLILFNSYFDSVMLDPLPKLIRQIVEVGIVQQNG